MEIIPIFEPNLYAVRYPDNEYDEFERLFDSWNDIVFLESFFEVNKEDLNSGFFSHDIVAEAVEYTRKEAKAFENNLYNLSKESKRGFRPDLDSLFKPLYNNESWFMELLMTKSYGTYTKSVLRIYAIKLESNVYIITGGAIKLTKTMNERPHLMKELDKMKKVRSWLKESGIIDHDTL